MSAVSTVPHGLSLLYCTFRISRVLELQVEASIQLSLWLHADCDVTSDPGDFDSNSSSQSSTDSRANGFDELPFRAKMGPTTACAGKVLLVFPGTGRGNCIQVSEAKGKAPSRRTPSRRRRDPLALLVKRERPRMA